MHFLRMTLSILMAALLVAVFLLIYFDMIDIVLLTILIIRGGIHLYRRYNLDCMN